MLKEFEFSIGDQGTPNFALEKKERKRKKTLLNFLGKKKKKSVSETQNVLNTIYKRKYTNLEQIQNYLKNEKNKEVNDNDLQKLVALAQMRTDFKNLNLPRQLDIQNLEIRFFIKQLKLRAITTDMLYWQHIVHLVFEKNEKYKELHSCLNLKKILIKSHQPFVLDVGSSLKEFYREDFDVTFSCPVSETTEQINASQNNFSKTNFTYNNTDYSAYHISNDVTNPYVIGLARYNLDDMNKKLKDTRNIKVEKGQLFEGIKQYDVKQNLFKFTKTFSPNFFCTSTLIFADLKEGIDFDLVFTFNVNCSEILDNIAENFLFDFTDILDWDNIDKFAKLFTVSNVISIPNETTKPFINAFNVYKDEIYFYKRLNKMMFGLVNLFLNTFSKKVDTDKLDTIKKKLEEVKMAYDYATIKSTFSKVLNDKITDLTMGFDNPIITNMIQVDLNTPLNYIKRCLDTLMSDQIQSNSDEVVELLKTTSYVLLELFLEGKNAIFKTYYTNFAFVGQKGEGLTEKRLKEIVSDYKSSIDNKQQLLNKDQMISKFKYELEQKQKKIDELVDKNKKNEEVIQKNQNELLAVQSQMKNISNQVNKNIEINQNNIKKNNDNEIQQLINDLKPNNDSYTVNNEFQTDNNDGLEKIVKNGQVDFVFERRNPKAQLNAVVKNDYIDFSKDSDAIFKEFLEEMAQNEKRYIGKISVFKLKRMLNFYNDYTTSVLERIVPALKKAYASDPDIFDKEFMTMYPTRSSREYLNELGDKEVSTYLEAFFTQDDDFDKLVPTIMKNEYITQTIDTGKFINGLLTIWTRVLRNPIKWTI